MTDFSFVSIRDIKEAAFRCFCFCLFVFMHVIEYPAEEVISIKDISCLVSTKKEDFFGFENQTRANKT